MAGDAVNIKVCSPGKLRHDLKGKCHTICHYLYNLQLAPMRAPLILKRKIVNK
jgi:hypothetical protein